MAFLTKKNKKNGQVKGIEELKALRILFLFSSGGIFLPFVHVH